MRSTITLVTIYFYALLSSCTTSKDEEDREWLISVIEFVQLDYEDHCEKRAAATWSELLGSPAGFSEKLERDKTYGVFASAQTKDVKHSVNIKLLKEDDDIVRRKVNLLLKPGDSLLEPNEWIDLVTFGDKAEHALRFASDYDCGTNANCTLRELHNNLATQQDENILRRMKSSWEAKLPSLELYLRNILPLVKKAAKKNELNTVEEYWEFLTEYEGAIIKARELWNSIKPLYEKLHKYIALKLRGPDAVGKPLPVHLLRSLLGDDWLNIIESLLPKHPDIYQKIYANIHLKELGGLNAYKVVESLIKELNLGDFKPDVESIALFNGTCPSVVVDFCKPGRVKTMSCKDVSLRNYIESHEAVMKIKYKQTVSLYSNNSYILREANRFSAVYEAIPGFTSLLALNPYALDRAGLYSIERFNYNPNHNRVVLQLISALRDLPKLNYYLAIDEWRLKILKNDIDPSNVTASWSEFRTNFSLIEPNDSDVLGDPCVLKNKPYLGKFMGLILKYQIYQSFAEELRLDESDLVKHVSENNGRIFDAMIQGFYVPWPGMISDLLAKREHGLEYTAVTDYYTLLDEYLDRQLNPSEYSPEEEYVEPVEPTEIPEKVEPNPEENEIPSAIEKPDDKVDVQQEKPEIPETHEKIMHNIINHGDESQSKFSTETSTIGVLEIKHSDAAETLADDEVAKASYNAYWWIGIAIAVVVVLVLIGIIARKRRGHRKQLDRQRHSSRA